MILTADHINLMVETGEVHISPYSKKNLGPNSYDLALAPEIGWYVDHVLDMKKKHEVVTVPISPKGFELLPGKIYLGSTVEECGSDHYVCCIEGRSSVGRLGIQVHMTAGFGDLGFKGRWTLEIRVAQPVVVYPFVRIAQAYFIKPYGMITKLYTGKYKGQTGIERSKMAEDFTPPTE